MWAAFTVGFERWRTSRGQRRTRAVLESTRRRVRVVATAVTAAAVAAAAVAAAVEAAISAIMADTKKKSRKDAKRELRLLEKEISGGKSLIDYNKVNQVLPFVFCACDGILLIHPNLE